MTTKTLLLVDGSSYLYRAYHALPDLRSPDGFPTGAIHGMVAMLKRALQDVQPEHAACVFDAKGDTFRNAWYPEYKAQRAPMPEDLVKQIEPIHEVVKLLGWPVLVPPGIEADDAIGTLARLAAASGHEVIISTGDKDLAQLVDEHVTLINTMSNERLDVAGVLAKFGVPPQRIVDYLTLMGDTVDNVPGVEGVGPKTAAQLIAEYGSLDNVIAHAADIKGKRGEKLREAIPQLPLSRELVTLRHDAPVKFDLAEADARRLKLEALLPILRELGFNRYQDEVRALMGEGEGGKATGESRSGAPTAPPGTSAATSAPATKKKSASPDPFDGGLFHSVSSADSAASAFGSLGPRKAQSGEYRCIKTRAQLDELIAEMRACECFAIDTETTSLSPHDAKLCGVSISTRIHTGAYIPVRSPTPDEHMDEATVLGALRPLLEDPRTPKCGHNLKYDALIFRKHGVKLAGFLSPLPEGGGRGDGRVASVDQADSAADPSSPPASPPPSLRRFVAPSLLFDSMVASYLIDATRSSHSLDALALALLNRTNISIKELIGSGADQKTFDTVPLQLATEYAAEDADVSLQLRESMLPQLRAMNLMPLFAEVEMPLVEVLAELEWNGITVDPAELEHQRARLQARIDDLRRRINDEAMQAIGRTFNPDSPKQLAGVLFNKPMDVEPGLGLRPQKKLKTGYSTDSEVLENLAEDPEVTTPIPKLILENRELTKLVGTYLVALKDAINAGTGRIHSSFNQTVAATGRLASSDPNLQNIPIRTEIGREIRRAFVAASGCMLVSADYSQIELRLLAHLSRDPALIEAFRAGEDIHTAVAAQIHGIPVSQVTKEQRNGAKMVNFGIVYGITSFGLARRLGVSNTAADEIIRGYKKRFAGITTFLQECIDFAQRHGYVQTMLGRRRPIPDIESTNPSRRAFAERTAINSVVQGSAADLIKLAMIEIQAAIEPEEVHHRGHREHREKSGTLNSESGSPSSSVPSVLSVVNPPPDIRMLLQIHDELVFETPREHAEAARAFIVHRMEHAMQLSVPLKADSSIASNWFDGK
jgi:DNA polymerase-1